MCFEKRPIFKKPKETYFEKRPILSSLFLIFILSVKHLSNLTQLNNHAIERLFKKTTCTQQSRISTCLSRRRCCLSRRRSDLIIGPLHASVPVCLSQRLPAIQRLGVLLRNTHAYDDAHWGTRTHVAVMWRTNPGTTVSLLMMDVDWDGVFQLWRQMNHDSQ